MFCRVAARTLAVLVTAATTVLASLPAAAVQTPPDPLLVTRDPVNYTPHVLDGAVRQIVQIGSVAVVGGTFTTIAPADRSTTIVRPNIFAFDAASGQILDAFAPTVDGKVSALLPDPNDPNAVLIAGTFTNVNGVRSKSVAKVTLDTGALVTAFRVPAFNGTATDLRYDGRRLLVAGRFTKVGVRARAGLTALNVATGARDDSIDLQLAGARNSGVLRVEKMDVTPDGSTLIIIGNFSLVQGQTRTQVALVNIGVAPAQVTDWATNRFDPLCAGTAFDTYMRDVDIAPDALFFSIVTTGGGFSGTLCDSATRWELGRSGPGQAPTWVDYTGSDTLSAVAVVGEVVYVGGHQRWLNNTFGRDRAGAGAVSRPGLAALDARNGVPLSWNPTRTRGVGVFDLYSTRTGLYAASDTDRFGGEFHGRLAFFPAGSKGKDLPPELTGSLPGAVVLGGPISGSTYRDDASYRWFDGAASTSPTRVLGGEVGWSAVRGATMIDSDLYTGTADGRLQVRSLSGDSFGPPSDVPLNNLTAFSNELKTTTGMTYDRRTARLYFTLAGSNSLFYRYFVPESRIVGADRFTVPPVTDFSPSTVAGMFLVGDTLYAAASSNGDLRAVTLQPTGLVAGTVRVVSGPTVDGRDWRARGLFVRTDDRLREPAAPAANIAVSCLRLSCTFDGSGSTDPDGWISSFSWSFSDGATATGPTVTHAYAAPGAYSATLTVTDNEGMSSSVTREVTVVSNEPPTAQLAVNCTYLDCQATTWSVVLRPAG